MTRLTEQYLLNYLEKKSLSLAADIEVRDSRAAFMNVVLPEMGPIERDVYMDRWNNAVAMQGQLVENEVSAYAVYMQHLRAERCARSS